MMVAALLFVGAGRTAHSFSKQHPIGSGGDGEPFYNDSHHSIEIAEKMRSFPWRRSSHACVEIVFVLLHAKKKVLDYG
jgi:hypothetical protein